MTDSMDLTGKKILVTGASSGLGRAAAVQAGRLGAEVVLVARREEELQKTARMMEGACTFIEPFDLLEVDDIGPWFKEVTAKTGPLNGFVHSAGINVTRPIRQLKPAVTDSTMRLNYFAASALTRAFRQNGCWAAPASIVFVSSIVALRGEKGISAYSASKGALLSATRCLACELAADGIRVNCICPGHVRTEMAEQTEGFLTDDKLQSIADKHPLGIGEPIDVANAVCFLLSDAAKWITGSPMIVDGGYMAA